MSIVQAATTISVVENSIVSISVEEKKIVLEVLTFFQEMHIALIGTQSHTLNFSSISIKLTGSPVLYKTTFPLTNE